MSYFFKFFRTLNGHLASARRSRTRCCLGVFDSARAILFVDFDGVDDDAEMKVTGCSV